MTQTDDDNGTTSSSGVEKSASRIRSMFGEISPRYDLLNHVLSGGTDYFWRRKTVRTIPPVNDAPILDVCTGTGDLAVAYWKKAKGRVPVIGTDFTHEMVRLAEKKSRRVTAKKNDRAPLSFLEADTLQLPFPDNRFQIVSVAFGLRNVADPARGLREMARVCRPGGSVVVLEFSLPRSRIIGGVYRWYFRRILPRLGQWLSGNNHAAYRYLPESVSEFPQGEELAGMLQQSGLSEVNWKSLTCGVATLYYGRKPN